MSSSQRPKLRSLEWVVVPDEQQGKVLVLRDVEGVAPSSLVVPLHFAPVLSRFDGALDSARIAAEASREVGQAVDAALVDKLAAELDEAFFLETQRFRDRKKQIVQAFKDADVRPASHAGGAYHGDPSRLVEYIEKECLAKAPARSGAKKKMIGLTAPHMDLWRAAEGYGHAYRAFAEALPREVDTFVLLGTSHAAMRRPFAICPKTFATPLGGLEPDKEAIRALSDAARFDVFADEYLHKSEHSLEFQVVFLKHALGKRRAKIVPILCGLGDAQVRQSDPAKDADAESFLSAVTKLVEEKDGKALIVAGADLAHVGPRFGDPKPLDARGREKLAKRDGESIDLALARSPREFFAQVASDLDTRRVCGLAPIYTLLRALPRGVTGEKLHYAQHVDPDEGSIVSHTSLGFYL